MIGQSSFVENYFSLSSARKSFAASVFQRILSLATSSDKAPVTDTSTVTSIPPSG